MTTKQNQRMTIAKRSSVEAQLFENENHRLIENEGALAAWLQDVDEELPAAIATAKRNKYAKNTNQNYDYWFGRLRKWCEDPTSRNRMRTKEAIAFETLFPVGRLSELTIAAWLADELLGPQDSDEHQEWMETSGPWAPSTLNTVVSAIKARSRQFQMARWVPSDDMLDTLAGFRRSLNEAHRVRQATPLLADQIIGISRRLWRVESPMLARDRVIFEAAVVGLTPGQIAKLETTSVVSGALQVAHSAMVGGKLVEWEEVSMLDGRRLVVPGQHRRGGKQDPPTVVVLDKYPQLEAALDSWLDARVGDPGPLLFAGVANPTDHVRKSLIRSAEISEVDWRPARNSTPTSLDALTIRTALDDRASWGGELRRQRDHLMLLVGWNAALRRSELCALTVGDIDFDADKNIAGVWVARSKTNEQGEEVPIRNPGTQSLPEVQVITLLRAWVEKLRSLGATDNFPLFPSFDRHGAFKYKTKSKSALPNNIDPKNWNDRLNELAHEAQVFGPGNERKYADVTGHSLRRGFVTQAILRGTDAVMISKITRHANVQMISTYADSVLARKADWTSYLFGGDQLVA